jgi:hypothetical protein
VNRREGTPRLRRLSTTLGLAALGACLILPGLGRFGLWEPWELRIADQATSGIGSALQAGPPAQSLLPALGIRLFGAGELDARLPGALVALGTLLAVAWAGRALHGTGAAVAAALVLLGLPLFSLQGGPAGSAGVGRPVLRRAGPRGCAGPFPPPLPERPLRQLPHPGGPRSVARALSGSAFRQRLVRQKGCIDLRGRFPGRAGVQVQAGPGTLRGDSPWGVGDPRRCLCRHRYPLRRRRRFLLALPAARRPTTRWPGRPESTPPAPFSTGGGRAAPVGQPADGGDLHLWRRRRSRTYSIRSASSTSARRLSDPLYREFFRCVWSGAERW